MKLQALGRYRLDNEVLGKGNFARVELATHSVLNAKVSPLKRVYLTHFIIPVGLLIQNTSNINSLLGVLTSSLWFFELCYSNDDSRGQRSPRALASDVCMYIFSIPS